MRILAIIFSFLVLLAVVAVVALPRLVPVETITAKVNEKVRAETGRDLAFTDMTFAFWPNIGLNLKNVSFSNASWASQQPMVKVEEANVALALMPLLRREIEIKRFVLDQPVVHLEVGPNGRQNWDFVPEKESIPSDAKQADTGAPGSRFGVKSIVFKIKDGAVDYADRQKGARMRFDGVNVSLSVPEEKGALKLEGRLTHKNKPLDIDLALEHSGDFLDKKASPGVLLIQAPNAAVKLTGLFSTGNEAFKGDADIRISSLTELTDWAGAGNGKPPFEKVSAAGKAFFSKSGLTLNDAKLSLDDIAAAGDVGVDLTNKPVITARLSLDKLSLDRFAAGKNAAADKPAPAPSTGANAGVSTDWSAAPFDLSGMKSVDADIKVDTQGFSLKGIDVGPAVLTANLKDGNLSFTSSEANLLGGKFSSELHLNSAPAVPTMALDFDMKGVEAKPVLAAFASFDKLSGKTDANISVSSSGASARDMISRLRGNGAVTFKNGSLEGINLVDIARMAQQRLSNIGVGAGKTDFVELSGTFNVTQGVAHNTDMKLAGPLLRASGSGAIDLPRKYLDFHVIPTLSANAGAEGATGISVPVDIRGPFNAIKVVPDFAGIAQGVLEDPKGTLQNLKNESKALGQNFKDIKKDFKDDPVKALQGLLGGNPAPAAPDTPPTASAQEGQ